MNLLKLERIINIIEFCLLIIIALGFIVGFIHKHMDSKTQTKTVEKNMESKNLSLIRTWAEDVYDDTHNLVSTDILTHDFSKGLTWGRRTFPQEDGYLSASEYNNNPNTKKLNKKYVKNFTGTN